LKNNTTLYQRAHDILIFKMLKIWSMVCNNPDFGIHIAFKLSQILPCADDLPQKQKQQQDANADAAAGIKRKKVTAAQLRVQKGALIIYVPSTAWNSSLLTFAPP
jgi:hypothetical protein